MSLHKAVSKIAESMDCYLPELRQGEESYVKCSTLQKFCDMLRVALDAAGDQQSQTPYMFQNAAVLPEDKLARLHEKKKMREMEDAALREDAGAAMTEIADGPQAGDYVAGKFDVNETVKFGGHDYIAGADGKLYTNADLLTSVELARLKEKSR